jgi:hypothetical protein
VIPAAPGRRGRVAVGIAAGLLLLGGAGALAWRSLRPDDAGDEVRSAEAAYLALRDAILQEDDAGFFRLHSREAREAALRRFPAIRAEYVASPAEERAAFQQQFGVTEQEFLTGRPEDLVARMLPWKSGWRQRRELFRRARIRDTRIGWVEPESKGPPERTAVIQLEVPEELKASEGQEIPDLYLPTVVLVKDPEGWRRRSFFAE